jgi:hypothetical protein
MQLKVSRKVPFLQKIKCILFEHFEIMYENLETQVIVENIDRILELDILKKEEII